MKILQLLKNPSSIIFLVVLLIAGVMAALAYHTVTIPQVNVTVKPTPTVPLPTPGATPTLLPVQSPTKVLGVASDPSTDFPGIGWVRLGYPSCGWGDLYGDVLKSTIEDYHSRGIRVLLTICQGKNDASLYNTEPLNDAA